MECDNTTGLKGKQRKEEQAASSTPRSYLISVTVIGRFVRYGMRNISEAYSTESGTR
jgi:hypothetical protein